MSSVGWFWVCMLLLLLLSIWVGIITYFGMQAVVGGQHATPPVVGRLAPGSTE